MTTNVTRLKDLLFDGERATLADLQRRLELVAEAQRLHALELSQRLQQIAERGERERRAIAEQLEQAVQRAGSDDRFRDSLVRLMDGALREAEGERHAEMSRAIAPYVVRTFRAELKNSEKDIVNLVYPHTGLMVQSYVQRAMRELIEQINRKLDESVASNRFMLRLKSWSTGRPMAELALAATQRPQVTDLFLIRRGSGELIQRWPAGPELSNADIHLSGVITAINDFAAQAFKDDGGAIRSFEMDNANIYLRASPSFLLVARVKGAELPDAESMVDTTFLRTMEQHRDLLSLPGGEDVDMRAAAQPALDDLAGDLDSRMSNRHAELVGPPGLGFNPLLALAVLIGLPVLAYVAWSLFVEFETASVRSRAAQELTIGRSTLMRAEIDVGRRGQTLRVAGIAPTEEVRRTTLERLRRALPGTIVEDRIEVLPNAMREVEPQIATVRRDIAGLEVEMLRNLLARSVDRSQRRLTAALADLRRLDTLAVNDAQRGIVRDVRAAAEQASDEIQLYQALAADMRGDGGTLATMSLPLHQAGERLLQASVLLSQYTEGTAPVAPRETAQAAPVDPQNSAEGLAMAAERLATLTLALVQSARVRPAPPVVVREPVVVKEPPPPPSAREQLLTWARAHAVFFGNAADYRDGGTADGVLRELAGLIKASGSLVRVIGYTDERGGATRNAPLAQQRADRVVADLVALGVPPGRLVAVGRANGPDISAESGPSSPNRRVEFEVGFVGE